jgi:hypothetical protein
MAPKASKKKKQRPPPTLVCPLTNSECPRYTVLKLACNEDACYQLSKKKE